jgi:hypothetical protein
LDRSYKRIDVNWINEFAATRRYAYRAILLKKDMTILQYGWGGRLQFEVGIPGMFAHGTTLSKN